MTAPTRSGPARVLAQDWMSFDGFAAGEHGEGDLFAAVSPEADAASQRWNELLLPGVDEVLLGRATYEQFADYWPTAEDAVAAAVNAARKTVFSRSLATAPWGSFPGAAVASDAVRYVRERRAAGAGTLLVWGSLSIVHTLLAAGELDELDLFIAPVALGSGRRLLSGRHGPLRLLSTDRWNGTLHARYLLERPGERAGGEPLLRVS